MKLVIDIPEEEYKECMMQVDMIKQEGFLIESLNTALKIHVANGSPTKGSYERGYNDAKREIALSGEYERAYQRGFEAG